MLEKKGRTEIGSLYEYAFGKLVLWVPRGSPLDLRQGLRVLVDPRIRRIAIANPAHAPYGRAAEAAMRQAGVYDRVKTKFVLGENISQTAEFVQTGNADIGLIALSLALAPTMRYRGRFVELAPDSYPPIRQGAVILRSSRRKTTAREFLHFLKGPRAGEVLRQYGFGVPR
jgi:molybdate transport system substrate-binding protein